MPVYRVSPPAPSANPLPPLGSARMDRKSKEEQIRRLQQLRGQGDGAGKIQKWIDRAGPRGVRLIFPGSPTAGRFALLVEMPPAEADRLVRDLPGTRVEVLPGFSVPQSAALGASRKARPTSPDRLDLWHLDAIGLTAARRKGFTGTGRGVTVAELGTGVDDTHPELREKIQEAVEFNRASGGARRVRRSVDTLGGYGTHVAGLICGDQVGVAPGVDLISAVMIPGGQGTLTDFFMALEWVANRPEIQVVVIAAGLPGHLSEMDLAITRLVEVGILPVVAVGNEGPGKTRSPGNCPDALSVGAADRRGRATSFSGSGTFVANNHRYHVPHLLAPGVDVVSCWGGGGYQANSGTSMATAIVGGLAALVLERRPEMTVADLKEALLSSGKRGGEPTDRQGHGLVQVKAAL